MRQLLVRSYAVTHQAGTLRPPQAPGWDQLVVAPVGSVHVTTATGTWALPPGAAAAVPDGWRHRCRVTSGTALRVLYTRADADLLTGAAEPHVVALDPLARALVLWLAGRAPVDLGHEAATAAVVLLRSVLRPVALDAVALPSPTTDDLATLAARVHAEPDDRWTPTTMAAEIGVSRRTFERRWRAETGTTPATWCTRARILAAAGMLATGRAVGEVAAATGWATPSGFTAAFGRHMGRPPTAWLSLARPAPGASTGRDAAEADVSPSAVPTPRRG